MKLYQRGYNEIYFSKKFLYTYFQNNDDIQQIRSNDKVADLFTKELSTSIFKNLVHEIGMRRLKNLHGLISEQVAVLFFLTLSFVSLDFPDKILIKHHFFIFQNFNN